MINLPPLYPIVDARREEPLAAQVLRLGACGFPLVQFRGKPLDAARQWTELAGALRAAADQGGWPAVCVNDRADLAVLASLEGLAPWGLHLGQARLAQLGHQRLCLHHIRRLNATDGKQRTLHLTTRHLHGQADARQGNLTGGRIRFAGQQGAEVAQLHSTPIQRG